MIEESADRREEQQRGPLPRQSAEASPLSDVSQTRPAREQQAVTVDFTVADDATAQIQQALADNPNKAPGMQVNVLDAAVQQQTVQLCASETASIDDARKVVRLMRLAGTLRDLQLEQSECEEAAREGDEAEQQRIAEYIPCLHVKIDKQFAALNTRDADGLYPRNFDDLYEHECDTAQGLERLAKVWRERHPDAPAVMRHDEISAFLDHPAGWDAFCGVQDVCGNAPPRAQLLDKFSLELAVEGACQLLEKEGREQLSPQEEVALEQLHTLHRQAVLMRVHCADLFGIANATAALLEKARDPEDQRAAEQGYPAYQARQNRRIAHRRRRLEFLVHTFDESRAQD